MFFNLIFAASLAFASCPGLKGEALKKCEAAELKDLPVPSDYQSCESKSDCVPNSSCHPTMAINKKYRKADKGVMCTMDCRTILDCGRGEIKCKDKKCIVIEKKEASK